jgi:methylthioribose-1-phosphate isomerase
MLQQMQQGQLNPQQQAELQRLGQQQDIIRKSLEQLNKEAKEQGQSKSLSSNLDEVLKQMQEVVKDMNTEKLDDQLVQKQEKILSKLLDAQRSINERDFEKNRESNTAKNILRESPADLNLSSEEGKDKLKDELNKAVREGFTRDYENLIRRYFEALQEKKISN